MATTSMQRAPAKSKVSEGRSDVKHLIIWGNYFLKINPFMYNWTEEEVRFPPAPKVFFSFRFFRFLSHAMKALTATIVRHQG
jgi:hypothetical protein